MKNTLTFKFCIVISLLYLVLFYVKNDTKDSVTQDMMYMTWSKNTYKRIRHHGLFPFHFKSCRQRITNKQYQYTAEIHLIKSIDFQCFFPFSNGIPMISLENCELHMNIAVGLVAIWDVYNWAKLVYFTSNDVKKQNWH